MGQVAQRLVLMGGTQGKAGTVTIQACVVEVRLVMGIAQRSKDAELDGPQLPVPSVLTVRLSVLSHHSDEVAAKAWLWRSLSARSPPGTGAAPNP